MGRGARVALGTFTLFDLPAQHLSRSTALPLAEATFPLLHVRLRFLGPDGKAVGVPASVVRAADVPPSREAQTLYTVVASSGAIVQKGRDSVATIAVPAQVPVERATVVLDPAFARNFVRPVLLDAKPSGAAGRDDGDHDDRMSGEIQRANLQPPALSWAPPIRVEHLSVDAVLAANLHQAADVTVSIENGDDRPLPVRAVELAMRQRKVCFVAAAGKALHAALWGRGRCMPRNTTSRGSSMHRRRARPQRLDRKARTRSLWNARTARPFTERHPDLLWIALFGVAAVLGATALASLRQQQAGE